MSWRLRRGVAGAAGATGRPPLGRSPRDQAGGHSHECSGQPESGTGLPQDAVAERKQREGKSKRTGVFHGSSPLLIGLPGAARPAEHDGLDQTTSSALSWFAHL